MNKTLIALGAISATVCSVSMADTTESLEAQRAAEIKSLIHEVLADADSRASFLDKKNSPISLNVGGFLQSRYTYNSGGSVEENHGFGIPRARLAVYGKAYDFNYRVSGEWQEGGGFNLMDAWASTEIAGLDLKVGQFRGPFMKSWEVYAADTLAADRSIVTYTFGQGRSQGLELGKDFGSFRIRGAYTDGFNSANGAGVTNGYALTGRADLDVTDWWTVGAGISWNDLDTSDYWTYTFDTGVDFSGFGLSAAYVGKNHDAGDDWATTVQASYFVTDSLQPFAQYEYGELHGSDDNLSIFTVGANYHINSNVKWTTDFGYSLNGVGAGWDLSNTGWSSSADEGEYLVRTQLQITF